MWKGYLFLMMWGSAQVRDFVRILAKLRVSNLKDSLTGVKSGHEKSGME
jgi:hypothetical protein